MKEKNSTRRDVFQAIADPTRRAIISLLAVQAMTPSALAYNFHSTRQAVSKHIRILNECELLEQKLQGREILYSLNSKKMKEIDKWLDQFRVLWENRLDSLDALLTRMNKEIVPTKLKPHKK